MKVNLYFPKGSHISYVPKGNDVYLKELKERITSYIKMWKETIGNDNSPIVIDEWKKN